MTKILLSLCGVLALSACASPTPYYAPTNFQQQSWATQSFDQVKANCRAESLEHHFMGDTYDLEAPRYKACMEKNGYRFSAQTNSFGQVTPAPVQPNNAPLYH